MNTRRQFSYPVIPDGTPCPTVRELLASQGYSRQLMIRIKQAPGGLMADGKPVPINQVLSPGQILTVNLPPEAPSWAVTPAPLPLDIVYEDEDLLVVNKAAGMPVHPSQGNHGNSLADALAWRSLQEEDPVSFRAVSRLDKDTSGLLVVARHPLSACILSDMIQKRQIRRTYLAAGHGDLRRSGLLKGGSSHFTISAPIGRAEGSILERRVDPQNGDPAVTHGRLLAYRPDLDASLAELSLETGRTHQIRVHMRYAGCPLFGDFLYHPDFRYIRRHSLHSWKLSFSHPITKKPLSFTAAVPDDMKCFTDAVLLDSGS